MRPPYQLLPHITALPPPLPSSPFAALLAVHAAFGGMLGAALGGFYTAFWYTLDTR